jgi:hypothetical protein
MGSLRETITLSFAELLGHCQRGWIGQHCPEYGAAPEYKN